MIQGHYKIQVNGRVRATNSDIQLGPNDVIFTDLDGNRLLNLDIGNMDGGSRYELPFLIQNNTEYELEYSSNEVIVDADWQPDWLDYNPSCFLLPAGESQRIELWINVPQQAIDQFFAVDLVFDFTG